LKCSDPPETETSDSFLVLTHTDSTSLRNLYDGKSTAKFKTYAKYSQKRFWGTNCAYQTDPLCDFIDIADNTYGGANVLVKTNKKLYNAKNTT